MTTADLARGMQVLTLLNQSGPLQQMVQEMEHHDGSFIHAPQTHQSEPASSLTNPFQSVPWLSIVTYAAAPEPPIHGEPIVRGVSTGVPEAKFFFETHAPKRPQVFEGSPSSKDSTIVLLTLQQLQGSREALQSRTSANLTTNPCVPYHRSSLTLLCTGLAGVPPRIKSPFVPRTLAPKPVACFTTTYKADTLDQALALGLGPLAPMALLPNQIQPVQPTHGGTKAFF